MNLYQIVSLKNQIEQTFFPVSTQKINLKVKYQEAKPGNCGLGCAVMFLNYYGETTTVEILKKKYNQYPSEGHLCLVSGLDDGFVVIQDPRNIGIYGKNLSVPIKTFLNIFTGNCIC